MDKQLIERLDDRISNYKQTHHGEMPLYVLVSPDDENNLYDALTEKAGLTSDKFVTTYKGSKIIGHLSIHRGDMLATNELPDTGS